MKRKKLVIILMSTACTMAVILGVYFLLRFTPMPKNTKIRDIEVDSFSIAFYLSEDDKLYIGGCHDDGLGLYENLDFRWGFLYTLRALFRNPYKPVLFAENVEQVFEASDGFLFTDTDRTLYYFGSQSNGTYIRVADKVKNAYAFNQHVYYVDTQGDAYRSALDGNNATRIGSNVAYIYSNGLSVRAVSASGEVRQFSTKDEVQEINFGQNGDALIDARIDYHGAYTLTKDGTTMMYRWNIHQFTNEGRMAQAVTHRALLADMYYDCLCYLDDSGTIVKFVWPMGRDHTETFTLPYPNNGNVVDIAVCYFFFYILFSDGTYIRQPHR